MIVERLDVENVRNIASAQLDLRPGLNLLIGPNGAGKTALLEAVHLLIRGRSFRTGRTKTLLRRGEKRVLVRAACRASHTGAMRLSFARAGDGPTELRRDGQPVRQSSELAALLPIQVLLPNLSELVFGGPALRRQWLDWGTFHVKHQHAAQLRSYLRALRHRNALLRSGDRRTLRSWTDQVAEIGEAVGAARKGYFERVEPAIEASLTSLGASLSVSLRYFAGWEGEGLAERLVAETEQDARTGVTRSGPHRADVQMRCGGEAAAAVLSRGQGKMVASALRLAQAQDLAEDGKQSLFLIDDVGAELDSAHSERFYRLLRDMDSQIIATSAHSAPQEMRPLAAASSVFHVKQGVFKAANSV